MDKKPKTVTFQDQNMASRQNVTTPALFDPNSLLVGGKRDTTQQNTSGNYTSITVMFTILTIIFAVISVGVARSKLDSVSEEDTEEEPEALVGYGHPWKEYEHGRENVGKYREDFKTIKRSVERDHLMGMGPPNYMYKKKEKHSKHPHKSRSERYSVTILDPKLVGDQNTTESPQLMSLDLQPGEYVEIPNRNGALSSKKGSLFMYVRVPNEAAVPRTLTHLASKSVRGKEEFRMCVTPDNRLQLTLSDGSVTKSRTGTDILDGEWHMAGFTTGSDGTYLFVDGQMVGASAGPGMMSRDGVKGGVLNVGKAGGNTNKQSYTVSDLTYWGEPLTDIQVSNLYANGQLNLVNPLQLLADNGRAIRGWWLLSDTVDSKVIDRRSDNNGKVYRIEK